VILRICVYPFFTFLSIGSLSCTLYVYQFFPFLPNLLPSPKRFAVRLLRTRIFRQPSSVAPFAGHDTLSLKSCCRNVPSSLALHMTCGLPSSTWKDSRIS
jgi:hypothetical protein